MKLHITGIEEAIKKIKRLEEIVKEAEDILWYLRPFTSLDYEGKENEQEK